MIAIHLYGRHWPRNSLLTACAAPGSQVAREAARTAPVAGEAGAAGYRRPGARLGDYMVSDMAGLHDDVSQVKPFHPTPASC